MEFFNSIESRGKLKFEYYANYDPSFTEIKNAEQAKDLLLNGWDKPVEEIKQKLSSEINKLLSDRIKQTIFNDVYGYIPNVPNAVMGLPKAMINVKKDTKKQKVIKFLIDTTVNCGTNSSQMTEFFTKVVARIALLEKKGYRCRIEIFNQYAEPNEKKTIVACAIKVKDEKQLFDIKRMSFVISHVGFFRVFGFAWEDCVKDSVDYDDYHCYGLGQALYYWSNDEKQKVIENTRSLNEQCVYINFKSDLKTIFGKGGEAFVE